MSGVFLYGPMAWEVLLKQITWHAVLTKDAELSGYALNFDRKICFPTLVRADRVTRGVFVTGPAGQDLPADVRDRIAYLAAGLGYVDRTLDVQITGEAKGQTTAATVYLPPDATAGAGQPWRLEVWRDTWEMIACFAVEEVFQHMGVIAPDILARMMPMILVRAAARQAARRAVPTDIRSDMAAEWVEIEAQHNRHAGFFLTRETTLRHPLFKGGLSATVKREVFVATDAAIVLPYDPVRDRVLLVEQFRMGPFGRGDPLPWMIEPVAGRVDPGEPPEETARRECVEEAGLALDRLEHISSHYCSPGCSTEYFHCYLGLCDLPDLTPGQGGLATENEDIRTHVLPFETAMALIPSGEAANGPLILSLLWLQKERERLRQNAG